METVEMKIDDMKRMIDGLELMPKDFKVYARTMTRYCKKLFARIAELESELESMRGRV